MAEVEISRAFVEAAMRHPGVVEHLGVVARRIKDRADQLAANEGVDLETWVEQNTRPKGRPQAVVYGDNVEQEWGSSRSDRRRILGRAGEEAS